MTVIGWHFRSLCGLALLATFSVCTWAAEPTTAPSVKQLDATRAQIGMVTFDQISREIRFPAVVNMDAGLLEFLVVHTHGKAHEALFTTDISATDLNLAFILLRYSASHELDQAPVGADAKPTIVAPEIKAAARINIAAEWQTAAGKTRRVAVNELIQHGVKATAMPPSPWLYTGSEFRDGKFAAQSTGDLIAIFMSSSALINYPGEDYQSDEVWTPFPKRLPPLGTAVTLILSPDQKTKPLPKP